MLSPTYFKPSVASLASYEKLALAFQGALEEDDLALEPDSNRLEVYIEQQISQLLDGQTRLVTLPILPATATVLRARIDEALTGPDELIPYLKEDPSVAAEIIRAANSGYLRRRMLPLENLEQAFQSIAADDLKALLISVVSRPTLEIKPVHFKLIGKPLWQHCRACALACASLAAQENVDPATAQLLGLIHEIGKIAIFKTLCAGFRATGSAMSPRPGKLAELVARHGQALGLLVLKDWYFPEAFSTALREQCAGTPAAAMSPLGRVLHFGKVLADAHLILQVRDVSEAMLEEVLEGFGLTLDRVYSIFPYTPRPQRP